MARVVNESGEDGVEGRVRVILDPMEAEILKETLEDWSERITGDSLVADFEISINFHGADGLITIEVQDIHE